ncbi:hypothetical protein AGMMS49992_18230 [Clostridia bacterium]|nr:hypothetical protein AGMMS49992_18230 [Clostridia bacterium]
MSGYVFVASNASKEEFIGIVKPIVKQHLGIYKLLTNGEDTNDVMLSEHDKTVMFALLDENFNIPAIDAVVIGDKVQIVDGLFNGKIGNIKRVNIHKRYAIVEIELFNTLLNYEVMLDVLKTT